MWSMAKRALSVSSCHSGYRSPPYPLYSQSTPPTCGINRSCWSITCNAVYERRGILHISVIDITPHITVHGSRYMLANSLSLAPATDGATASSRSPYYDTSPVPLCLTNVGPESLIHESPFSISTISATSPTAVWTLAMSSGCVATCTCTF